MYVYYYRTYEKALIRSSYGPATHLRQVPGIIERSTTGGFRPAGGGVEENPLKSCLSVSRVETGTPGGGGCVLVRHVS